MAFKFILVLAALCLGANGSPFIRSGFGAGLSGGAKALTGLVENVAGNVADTVGASLNFGSDITGIVSSGLGAKAALANSISGHLSNGIGGLGDLQNQFGGIPDGIKGQIESSIDGIKNQGGFGGTGGIKNKIEGMKSQIEGVTGGLKGNVGAIKNQFEGVTGKLKDNVGIMKTKIEGVTSGLKENAGAIKNQFEGVTGKLKDNVGIMKTKIEGVTSGHKENAEGIKNQIEGVTDKLNEKVAGNINQIEGETSVLQKKAGEVLNQIEALAGELKEIFGEVSELKNQITVLTEGLKEKAVGAVAESASDIGGYEDVSFDEMKADLIRKKNQMYEVFNSYVQQAAEKSGKSTDEIEESYEEGLNVLSVLSAQFDAASTKDELWGRRQKFVTEILSMQADLIKNHGLSTE